MPPSPILVTGMHRSGTTWVGRMLSADPQLVYVDEPLNPLLGRLLGVPVEHHYTYIHSGNESCFLGPYHHLLRARPRPLVGLSKARSPRDVARVGAHTVRLFYARLGGRQLLLKDPYAVFSAEWFADRLGCRVVIVVRHPAAVVASLKRLEWRAPLAALWRQPALVDRWLIPFRKELRDAEEDPRFRRDVVWSNAVLWRLIHAAVSTYVQRRPDFTVITHEALSRAPRVEYSALYDLLDLAVTEPALAVVSASSSPGNPTELDVRNPHAVRVDSRANIGNWRDRLSLSEVECIRALTEPIACAWYGEDDW
jgi:hypothetical protein